ncbi:MAG: hypothetical protein H8E16_00970 [Flavobacteriales bacterium]|nr:hypothetical protein [Flavobacteriales bacterium]
MKTEDLRIGNLLYWIISPEVKKLHPVLQINTVYINDEIPNNYEPIPLDTEWLIKLGFKQENDGLFYRKPYNQKPIYSRGEYFGFNSLGAGSVNCNEFKYVHQLQNLYYVLTGEELTLNEI